MRSVASPSPSHNGSQPRPLAGPIQPRVDGPDLHVGRIRDRVVVRIEQAVAVDPRTAWRAVISDTCAGRTLHRSGHRSRPARGRACEHYSGSDYIRWQVDRLRDRAYLALTICVDGFDLDSAASTCTRHHISFEQVVDTLRASPHPAAADIEHRRNVEARYRQLMAEAMTDAD